MKAKKAYLLYATLVLVGSCLILHAGQAYSQSSKITHTVVKDNKSYPSALGRDLWFTMTSNYDASGYYELFVASPVATTVHIQTNSFSNVFPIKAGQVLSFSIPNSWALWTSGEVENKGVHVWSNDADLSAYLLEGEAYTTDGTYIIPTIGWGTDYVVAGYQSLFEGFGNTVFDYPSEFAIVADEDQTVVTITPTQDIRASHKPNSVLHPKGKPFTERLDRGQSVQYQLVEATNSDDFDVTGTIIHSTKP